MRYNVDSMVNFVASREQNYKHLEDPSPFPTLSFSTFSFKTQLKGSLNRNKYFLWRLFELLLVTLHEVNLPEMLPAPKRTTLPKQGVSLFSYMFLFSWKKKCWCNLNYDTVEQTILLIRLTCENAILFWQRIYWTCVIFLGGDSMELDWGQVRFKKYSQIL